MKLFSNGHGLFMHIVALVKYQWPSINDVDMWLIFQHALFFMNHMSTCEEDYFTIYFFCQIRMPLLHQDITLFFHFLYILFQSSNNDILFFMHIVALLKCWYAKNPIILTSFFFFIQMFFSCQHKSLLFSYIFVQSSKIDLVIILKQ